MAWHGRSMTKLDLDVHVRVRYSAIMDSNQTTYYIGGISKELKLSQRAVRYYEELGFIKPTRTEGKFRVYSRHDFDLLKLVIGFKDLGMTLEEIKALILPGGGKFTFSAAQELRGMLILRRKEFETKIKKYGDGIAQIDRVLDILSNCATCGKPADDGVCEDCLKRHGADSSALIPPLGTG